MRRSGSGARGTSASPALDAIDSNEVATIVAALRRRLAAIGPPLAKLLDAAVPVLTKATR